MSKLQVPIQKWLQSQETLNQAQLKYLCTIIQTFVTLDLFMDALQPIYEPGPGLATGPPRFSVNYDKVKQNGANSLQKVRKRKGPTSQLISLSVFQSKALIYEYSGKQDALFTAFESSFEETCGQHSRQFSQFSARYRAGRWPALT